MHTLIELYDTNVTLELIKGESTGLVVVEGIYEEPTIEFGESIREKSEEIDKVSKIFVIWCAESGSDEAFMLNVLIAKLVPLDILMLRYKISPLAAIP